MTELKTVAASIQGQVPAGRFGSAREIAQAVVYLASDESAYMVGGELMIDGANGDLVRVGGREAGERNESCHSGEWGGGGGRGGGAEGEWS